MPREVIDHPAHYGGNQPYEAINVIHAWGLNFALGSVLKYICRAGKKPGADDLEDLEKALWYLKHEINKRRYARAAQDAGPLAPASERERSQSQPVETPEQIAKNKRENES